MRQLQPLTFFDMFKTRLEIQRQIGRRKQHGSVRGPPGFSPWSYKLDSYNSTKDFLLNTQTHLGDPCIETSEGGQIGRNRAGGNGEGQRLVSKTQPGGIESTFLPGWSAHTVAKPSNGQIWKIKGWQLWSSNSNHQKTRPQMHTANAPHPPRAHSSSSRCSQ